METSTPVVTNSVAPQGEQQNNSSNQTPQTVTPTRPTVVGTTPALGKEYKKLEENIVGKILTSLQRGLSISAACTYAGIHRDTYYEHLKKDPELSDRVERAKHFGSQLAGDIVVDVLLDSTRGKEKDPRTGKPIDMPKYSEKIRVSTARWWLQTKQPEEFGRGLPQPTGDSTINNNQTNNYLFITDAEFKSRIIEQTGINNLGPEDVATALKAPDVEPRNSEDPALAVSPEVLRGGDATVQNMQ